MLTNLPSQPSLTQMINHLTQDHSTASYMQQQSGQITRHPNGQVLLSNGQQGAPQLQGHVLSQLQPAQGHRDPAMAKLAQLSNQLHLRNQMDARNYGQQPGQSYSNQMQPPASPHMAGNSQVHSGTPSNGLPSQLQSQSNAQALSQLQGQASPQVLSGGAVSGGNGLSLSGNQIQLQLNHAQALSQLQGQSTMIQLPSPALSGGHASPNFNQLSQQTFQSLSKQLVTQPSGQVHSQSHSLNHTVANGGQQSLPGTPQSEMSDLRSNA